MARAKVSVSAATLKHVLNALNIYAHCALSCTRFGSDELDREARATATEELRWVRELRREIKEQKRSLKLREERD
jgi:hypothetical protein